MGYNVQASVDTKHPLIAAHEVTNDGADRSQLSNKAKERRITRWEHEHALEAARRRLDEQPERMRQRRETVEQPLGTIKAWMGSTHFLIKILKRVRTEMTLHVLAYNLKRVMIILGITPRIAAIRA